MPFVIIKRDGQLLRNADGDPIILGTREEAEDWLQMGERIEPYRETSANERRSVSVG